MKKRSENIWDKLLFGILNCVPVFVTAKRKTSKNNDLSFDETSFGLWETSTSRRQSLMMLKYRRMMIIKKTFVFEVSYNFVFVVSLYLRCVTQSKVIESNKFFGFWYWTIFCAQLFPHFKPSKWEFEGRMAKNDIIRFWSWKLKAFGNYAIQTSSGNDDIILKTLEA